METIGKIIITVNNGLDKSLLWIVLVGLLSFSLFTMFQGLNKSMKQQAKGDKKRSLGLWVRSFGRSLYLFLFSFTIQAILFAIFYFSPPIVRWGEIYVGFGLIGYFLAAKKSRQRGLYAGLAHTTVALSGWLIGGWIGLFFISGILLLSFYYWLYRLALVIVPASDPDSFMESIQRFQMLVWYLWGWQFPVWVVKDHAGRIVEERISGDAFKNYALPGAIWVQSNQAVGITAGTQFSRVEGPGLIYTRPYERPFEVVDLKAQIRTSLIEAISQDGIPYQARILAVFRIDNETWTDDEYRVLRLKNTLLRGAQRPDRGAGNYRYSRGRVTATLSIQGVKHSFEDKEGHPIVHWDQWVLARVEEAARKELSRRSLDELWRSSKDEQDINALDAIATDIRNSVYQPLKTNGVHLIAARVVNFQFEGPDAAQVLDQQIDNWKSLMDRDISRVKSRAEARSVKIREEALAYARSTLLASIAEGLDQINETHGNLPKKYIIAVRFLGAIENWLHQQPMEEEGSEKLDAFRSRIRNFLPPLQRF